MNCCVLQAPACFGCLFAVALLQEVPDIIVSGQWRLIVKYWALFSVAACCGFATNLLAYVLIKQTGSLTLKVLCFVRNILVIVVGFVVYSDQLGLVQAMGYTISLAAFGWYSVLKSKQHSTTGK